MTINIEKGNRKLNAVKPTDNINKNYLTFHEKNYALKEVPPSHILLNRGYNSVLSN